MQNTNIDEGDKILLEETTYGKFTFGETIKGLTSGATKVLTEDLNNNRLIISAKINLLQMKLLKDEDFKSFKLLLLITDLILFKIFQTL